MNEETSVLTNRQLGFEIKAANNMIRRKIDAIFAQMEGNEINGMQGPLLGYLYRCQSTSVSQEPERRCISEGCGEGIPNPQIHGNGNAPKSGTEGLYRPGGIHGGCPTEKDPVDGESDRASQSDRRADPGFQSRAGERYYRRREADILNYFR